MPINVHLIAFLSVSTACINGSRLTAMSHFRWDTRYKRDIVAYTNRPTSVRRDIYGAIPQLL